MIFRPAEPEHQFEFPHYDSYQKELIECPLSIHDIKHILSLAGDQKGEFTISKISTLSGYSNDIVRINLENGRRLMIKQAQYDWVGPRFDSSRRASRLIRQKSSLIAPEHLPISETDDHTPLLAYWFIPLPTLKGLWPDLSEIQKKNVLRSLGHMLRELHKIEVDQYGLLIDNSQTHKSISAFMKSDLIERLKPAIWAHWSDAVPLVDQLTKMSAELPDEKPSLVHNDLHLDNILCKVEDGEVQCVGLLDLEAAGGGRFESDIASAIILHDPFFSREDEEIVWLENFDEYLKEGYGKKSNPLLLRFFKAYHLINMGFFFAHNGDKERADRIHDSIQYLL